MSAAPTREPLDEPLETLASADPAVRLGAVQALAAAVESERRRASYQLMETAPPEVQAAAARQRARFLTALPRLQGLLTDPSPTVRGEAVYALGGLGADAAFAAEGVRHFLRDPANPPTYRQHAPLTLARILGSSALQDLDAVIGAPTAHALEVNAAFFALGELGAPALASVVAYLSAPEPALRRAAGETLGRMGTAAASAVPALVAAATTDASYGVRAAAVRALLKVEPALSTSESVVTAAALDPAHSRRLCDDVAMALARRPVTNRFDDAECGRTARRVAPSMEDRWSRMADVLAQLGAGAPRGVLEEVSIGEHGNTRDRYVVGCIAPQPQGATIDAVVRKGEGLPEGGTRRFTLVVARLDADDRVLDHRIGVLDAGARMAECHDAQSVWQPEPTRWPVVTFGYRAAYPDPQGPVMIDWRASVLAEQMAWHSRFPVVFARGGGFFDQLATTLTGRDAALVVGATSGVVQTLTVPATPLNARFATSGTLAMGVPMVVTENALLAGPFAAVTFEARPWTGAPTPLPRFISAGFQAALDPAAGPVSSLEFWRAQLTHPHMAIRLAAIHKLMETGFAADVVQPVAGLLTLPTRYADLVGEVAMKVGPPMVPALTALLRSGDPVAVRRAASLLVRPEFGGVQDVFDVATDASVTPDLRETVLEALDLRGGTPSDAQAGQLAAQLSHYCGAPARGCWRALNVLQRTGPNGRSAVLPAVRAVMSASSRPFDRVQAARAVAALGDQQAAWSVLVTEASAGSDQTLAAMSMIDTARARPVVLAAFTSANLSMRSEATRILMADAAPGEDVIRAATPLLADVDPQQRLRALQVLQRARTPAVDTLVAQALRDPDARVRDAATPMAIARIDTMLPQLREAMRQPTARRRADIVSAIGRLGADGLVAMPDLLAALDTSDASLRVSFINAIHAVGRDELPIAELERFAATRGVLPPEERRMVVLQTLTSAKRLDARALRFLRSMLSGQPPQVLELVVRALEKIGPPALPTLRRLDVPTTSPDVLSQVRSAIRQLQPGGIR